MKILLEDVPDNTEIKISCNASPLQDIDCNTLSNKVSNAFSHLQVQVDRHLLGRLLQLE